MQTLNQVEKFAQSNVVLAIVGNKADYVEGRFDKLKVEEYCKTKSIDQFEVSAKSGTNVEEVFRNMA